MNFLKVTSGIVDTDKSVEFIIESENSIVFISMNPPDLLSEYDFVMYEFPFTDEAVHNQDFELALKYIDRIERFLDSLLTNTDLNEHLILGK